MADYYNIAVQHSHLRRPEDVLYLSVPGDDLEGAREQIEETFGDALYEIITDNDTWEGVEFPASFTIDDVYKLADMANSEQFPASFLRWVSEYIDLSGGLPEDLPQQFNDRFRGEFADLAEYAQDYADDQNVPSTLFPFVDWESLGRDLVTDYKVLTLSDGRIALFRH